MAEVDAGPNPPFWCSEHTPWRFGCLRGYLVPQIAGIGGEVDPRARSGGRRCNYPRVAGFDRARSARFV